MDKKLKKYIERYDLVEDDETHELMPDGGMILLVNKETACEVHIDNKAHTLDSFQSMLMNPYEESILITSSKKLDLIAVRFKGAGASFFYDDKMDALMQSPNKPMYIKSNITENELDAYFKDLLTPSKLPFNIMKVIDLLDEQGCNYSIDEVLAIANVPRKVFDKMFRLKTGLTFKTYAALKELDEQRV